MTVPCIVAWMGTIFLRVLSACGWLCLQTWPILFSEALVSRQNLKPEPRCLPLGGLPSLSHKTGDMYIQCGLL